MRERTDELRARERVWSATYYNNHRDERLASQRKKYDPKRERIRQLKKNYGITLEEYQKLETEQKGLCKICDEEPTKNNKRNMYLHVDHDHKTGRVRGLLCGPCNRALGLLKENRSIALKVVEYLNE